MFEVTEIDQDIFGCNMVDNQNTIDSIYECKVVVIILNETLKYNTYEHLKYFFTN